MDDRKTQPITEPQRFYTLKEAAELLKLSRSGLHRLVQYGVINAIYLGRVRRIPAAELSRLANQHK